MDETYNFDEKTEKDEGQDAMDDIDAFEKRMRGEASAKPLQARVRAPVRRHRLTTHRRATATVLQDNKPKFASKPVKRGFRLRGHCRRVGRAAGRKRPP